MTVVVMEVDAAVVLLSVCWEMGGVVVVCVGR